MSAQPITSAEFDKKACHVCDRSLAGDRLALIVENFFGAFSQMDEYVQCPGCVEGPHCTECLLSTAAGACDLMVAVERIPVEYFQADMVNEIIVRLAQAKKLSDDFADQGIVFHLVALLAHHIDRIDLFNIISEIAHATQDSFAISVMQKLSQYKIDEQCIYEMQNGLGEWDSQALLELRQAAASLQTFGELQHLFKLLDDRSEASQLARLSISDAKAEDEAES
ncbi:hypothetical protein F4821DRAFT_257237 [Hypoxylon rubiginosum]|uniref:Uncharacterized protein n=1 Tax=Hypoxylon rubiginosum TaxID=110542 RepID=A0ACC0D8L8_9PEZI|nr:hypothetical protein F4821DRAFT_257237 [Hypoxylon rubiginosum]